MEEAEYDGDPRILLLSTYIAEFTGEEYKGEKCQVKLAEHLKGGAFVRNPVQSNIWRADEFFNLFSEQHGLTMPRIKGEAEHKLIGDDDDEYPLE